MQLTDEIKHLKRLFLSLSEDVRYNFQMSTNTFLDFNQESLQKVIHLDEKVNKLEIEIEEACLNILAKHQPVAKDLRFIVAILKMNNDLERISDLAVKFANRLKYIPHDNPKLFYIPEMVDKTKSMYDKCMKAFETDSKDLALEVIHADDEIDRLKHQMKMKMILESNSNPNEAEKNINLLLNARHLERIADLTTNIAEELVYYFEGVIIRHSH